MPVVSIVDCTLFFYTLLNGYPVNQMAESRKLVCQSYLGGLGPWHVMKFTSVST